MERWEGDDAVQSEPSVSVIIPMYNAARTIERAISTLERQTRPVQQIVLVDDCSTDETWKIVSRWNHDPRFLILRQDRNLGPAAARNRAIRAATSDYVSLLDSDDAWTLDRNQNVVSVIREKDPDIVADNLFLFDYHANTVFGLGFPMVNRLSHLTPEFFVKYDNQRYSTFSMVHIQPYIKRSFLIENSISYDESRRVGEDFKFQIECLLKSKNAYIIPNPGYIYTTPFGRVSGKASETSHSRFDFDENIQLSRHIIETFSDLIGSDLRRELNKRESDLPIIEKSIIARRMRREGRLLNYLHFVLTNPPLLLMLVNWQIDRLLGRRIERADIDDDAWRPALELQ